jgi:hydrogenase maturation protease
MMRERGKNTVLVVGYGNSLRGDDGAGRMVADAIADEALACVRVISTTQLVPEIAAEVAGALGVIFVDASAENGRRGVRVRKIRPSGSETQQTHVLGPTQILQLAQECFGRAPRAWLITVPAEQFEVSTELSCTTREHAAKAVTRVKELIRSLVREVMHA